MDEKHDIVVHRFPENVDKLIEQATRTLHDLDLTQPGTTLNAIQDYFDSMHEESKLRIELLKLQLQNATNATPVESLSTIPSEVKEVKQTLAALSNTMKAVDRRLKTLESQRTETTTPPVKKGWQRDTQPHHTRGNKHQREGHTPAVPQLPRLEEVQQHAKAEAVQGDAVKNEVTVSRDATEKGTAKETVPFNSSLSSQIQAKVKSTET